MAKIISIKYDVLSYDGVEEATLNACFPFFCHNSGNKQMENVIASVFLV